MDPLSLTVGITAVCAFLLVIPFLLEKGIPFTIRKEDGDEWILGHSFLKILSVGVVLGLLTIIPTALFEQEDYCEFVVTNSTEFHIHLTTPPDDSNTTTTIDFTYDWVCVDNPDGPAMTFLRGYTWTLYVIFMYLGVFIIFLAIYWWREIGRFT